MTKRRAEEMPSDDDGDERDDGRVADQHEDEQQCLLEGRQGGQVDSR